MYLRSYRGKNKGWYENNNIESKGDRGSGGRSNRSRQRTTGSGDIINKSSSSSAILLSNGSAWQLLVTREINQLGLERGMSEGERAVITPRIGWRKLTDPGD